MSHIDLSVYSSTAAEAIRHMIGRVEATPYETDPFPHIAIRDFFPSALYRRILAEMPPNNEYQSRTPDKHGGYGDDPNRRNFRLVEERISRLTPAVAQLWRDVRDAISSPELKRAVFTKLAGGLAFRYGIDPKTAAEVPGYPRPELYREIKGYRNAPHPDTRRKVVTMQMSLAADDSQKDLGTSFYKRSLNPAAWLREPRGFDIVKRMSFAPNAAYAFVVLNNVTKKSWHGRETLKEDGGTRNSILHVYYGDPKDGNQEIVQRLYSGDAGKRAAA